MMVMTVPWHWLGLQGQWRRVANFNYADPIIAGWGPWVIVSFVGGLSCSASACCSCAISRSLGRTAVRGLAPLYALAVHPPHRVPAALNGFRPLERGGVGLNAAGLWLSRSPSSS
jgi:cytochrome c oxidase subunit 1